MVRAAVLFLFLAVCPPALDVRSMGPGQVRVAVKSVPLADVLECVSQKTGVKVVYDGLAPPRQRVSAVVAAGTVAEAVDELFEGQGLDYALGVDRDGKGLLVVSASAPGAPSSRPARRGEPDPGAEEAPEGEAVAPAEPPIEPTVPAPPELAGPADVGMPEVPASPPGRAPGFPGPLYPDPAVLSPSTYP